VSYSDDAKTIFLSQTVEGRARLSAIHLPDGKPVTLTEGGGGAAGGPRNGAGGGGRRGGGGGDAGSLVTRVGSHGVPVVLLNAKGDTAYLSGTLTPRGPDGGAPQPWLDKIDITTGKKERIFASKADAFEQPTLIDAEGKTLLVSRQTSKDVPNTFFVDIASKAETQLTQNKDYLPDLTQAHREHFTVTRADGIKFQCTVTFPQGGSTKLPAIFWFYPAEFESQTAYDASKRNVNKNLFTSVTFSNRQIFARAGYLVVEPDCPIVGPAGRMNDTYVSQLRNNLSATIDELDRRGWIDRQRLAISGHSYGAFSTANAMVATPFFKAGIAGDGNYNRSLTPFGFQNEQREIWEGRDTYLAMSPILYVDQITGALLMYHGMEDQNVGTDPINSEKMFAALTALGKPAELTMYPYEDHGQIAQETVLDQWARWVAWLDKWLKPAAPAAKPVEEPDGG
jgi:dipeptidyl aminopeptidase/acylaminoacyl peptidase